MHYVSVLAHHQTRSVIGAHKLHVFDYQEKYFRYENVHMHQQGQV